MRSSQVLSLIASLIVLAVAIFFIAVGIKAGIEGTSYIDALQSIFGVTADVPVDTPVDTPTDTPEIE